MTTEQKIGDEYPFAVGPQQITVKDGDRLILILRSITWNEQNVQDVIDVLDRLGLEGRYAILYLDSNDEAHVIRGVS